MKGDFSRGSYNEQKHYSGVLMQQGRVQTDADWNEQEAIQRRRTQVEARDVIGRTGAPRDNAGFAIALAGHKLTIGAGRYYVAGMLCENEINGLAYEAQPDYPGAADWEGALARAGVTLALVYLDVWERHITPLDDPLLREVALGGPDTATRVKTVWQVKVLPVAVEDAAPRLKELQAQHARADEQLAELITAGASPAKIAAIQSEIARIDALIGSLSGPPGCDGWYKAWDDLVAEPDRRMNARTQIPTAVSGPCVVPPTAGYRRLENQLYRVEVQRAGALSSATFKWSRDNGCVATSIEKIGGKDVTVHDLGPDEVLGFAAGQWVEISDDRLELDGRPGQLLQIDSVSASLRRITFAIAPTPLSGGADGIDPSLHPKLRRWDQNGATATIDGVAMTAAWLSLEDGVEVRFEVGSYRTGDYWLIPARTATGEIEWPPFAVPNSSPEPQRRRGIHHHFCRLALLEFDPATRSWGVIQDCRQLFPPLTGLTSLFYVSGDGQEAMPGEKLPKPLQVGVANGQWPVVGKSVRFETTTGQLDGTGLSVTVVTNARGVAECNWTLDGSTRSQQVEASLVGAPNPPVRFNANLSIASQVSYTPTEACSDIADVHTVQEALDRICQTRERDPGIRIRGIRTAAGPLENDSDVVVDDFIKGILIEFDGQVDEESMGRKPPTDPRALWRSATCYATLDLPYPITGSEREQLRTDMVLGFQPLVLAAELEPLGEGMLWAPAKSVGAWLGSVFFKLISGLSVDNRALVCLTLKGNFIWAREDPRLYLDGEVFGTRARGGLTAIDLRRGSGDGRKGGDFEMWFWLVARQVDRPIVLIPAVNPTFNPAILNAVNLAVDPGAIRGSLPEGFSLAAPRRFDPEEAVRAVRATPRAARKLVALTTPQFAKVARAVVSSLEAAGMSVQLLTRKDVVRGATTLLAAPGGLDLVIGDAAMHEQLSEALPGSFGESVSL
jgi:hypothetical protein